MTGRSSPSPRRAAALLLAGVMVAMVLVLLDQLPQDDRDAAPAPPATAVVATDRLGPGDLDDWCRDRVGVDASAEWFGGDWWCAGRPGGVWRMTRIDLFNLCTGAGRRGDLVAASAAAVVCRPFRSDAAESIDATAGP